MKLPNSSNSSTTVAEPIGHRKVNVLIVDDHPDKLLSLEAVLTSLGENIVTAPSGRDALRRLMEQDFAVILLDVNMPDMDGFEAAAMIRQHPRCAHTPIIFVTAFGDSMHTEKGYSLGAVDYILSPVVPDVLRTKISVFADLFRKSEEIKQHAEERIALIKEQAARASAEEATRRSSFLAEATAAMTRSLDAGATLRGINQVVLPFLAETSAIVLVDEQQHVTQVELAWVDDGGQRFSASVKSLEVFPPRLHGAIEEVLRTGNGSCLQVLSMPTHSEYPTCWCSEKYPTLKLCLAVALPLTARNRTIGALVLGVRRSSRAFGPTQLSLAEDLAGRAGIAIDNSRLHENMKEQDRRKDEFLAMLGHELRNPLAPIRNAVEILRMTDSVNIISEQARDMIERQVGHMARLIDDLLDVSRIARGKIQLHKRRCDLTSIVRETIHDHRPSIAASGLTLEVDIPDSPPFWVLSDRTRISQIVGNLLQNAQKFTDPGGTILVRLAPHEGRKSAVLTVRDNGIGMDRETLAVIFLAFSQADRSLDRSRGGLGLGLALVKGLVDLHGGSVYATSRGLGQGSDFEVHLPLELAPESAENVTPPACSDSIPYRILIIEDNRDGAESMRMLLSLLGHQAVVSHDGYSGIEVAREIRPDVVLCDIGLPGGLDGYDVARQLRTDSELNGMVLIALTGYGTEEDQRRAVEAGFNHHMTKPVSFQDMAWALNALVCDPAGDRRRVHDHEVV